MVKVFAKEQRAGVVFANHVTPFLTLKDRKQHKLFDQFRRDQTNLVAFIILQLMLVLYIPYEKWLSFANYPSTFSMISLVIGFLSPVLVGLLLLCVHIYIKYHKVSTTEADFFGTAVVYLESMWVVGFCTSCALTIAVCVYNGPCPHGGGGNSEQGCRTSAEGQMPEGYTMLTAILPALCQTIVRAARWEFTVLSFLIIIVINLSSIISYNLMDSLYCFIFFLPMCALVMYENQRQSLAVFLLTQSQEDLLEENERLAEEAHANELRHMIGNVAHDLKTVRFLFHNFFISYFIFILYCSHCQPLSAGWKLCCHSSASCESIWLKVRLPLARFK